MRESITPPYFGRTIFAEDVRLEASGQLTAIGLFNGGISVAQFPSALPKFAMLIEYQQRVDQEVLPVTIRAYVPGSEAPFFEYTHEVEAIVGSVEPEVTVDEFDFPGPRVHRILQVSISSMLEVRKAGLIRVRGFRGDEVLAMGALHVVAQS